MHGDAWRTEDQQQHRDEHHARRVPRRPQDPRRVPHPGPHMSPRHSPLKLQPLRLIEFFAAVPLLLKSEPYNKPSLSH